MENMSTKLRNNMRMLGPTFPMPEALDAAEDLLLS